MNDKHNVMIDILLSTYNGECYLREQLDSVLSQSNQDWKLIIRDDGSKDSTLKIIEEYATKYPEKIIQIVDDLGNLGVIKSFERLLEQSIGDYIMFCDQDDVWLQNKIEITLKALLEIEQNHPDIPVLIHTDLTVVDERLNVINDSCASYAKIYPEVINQKIQYMAICNSITGCTMMINRRVKDIALPFAVGIEMHDAWIGLCVKKGGVIKYINSSTILYRQHGKNVIGISSQPFSLKEKLFHISDVYRNNKEKCQIFRRFVSNSVLSYLYYKTRYFILIRMVKR